MNNRHSRSESRSLAFHEAIARKLRRDPSLWSIPLDNIRRWSSGDGSLAPVYKEWLSILTTTNHDDILSILVQTSEEAKRLRSSTPFTGILTDAERQEITSALK